MALPSQIIKLAAMVGVRHPERIRLVVADDLPMPPDPILDDAALQAGLLGPDMVGLTLGYAVFIRRGHENTRLLTHEFRHVHQFESHGTLAEFLREYLSQIVQHGYRDSPYERDARAYETIQFSS